MRPGTGINLVDVERYSAGGKWLAAIVLFLGVDCAYYWFHRIAHEYNAPWAGHVVHHSSEDYNLAVALRQGTFQGLFSWVFYLPLALVGFPPAWFAAVSSFDTLYQFWIHTRLIGKLGPLEWVFNTPSHHRVHHARNPKYLDKNYAGTLIIWDRMFGTFQAEEEEPVYGLVKPLNSWNPLWANLHVWNDLFRDAWLAPRWSDKLRIWFMPPGWRPEGLPPNPSPPEVSRADGHPLRHEDAARVECLRAGAVRGDLAGGLRSAGGRQVARSRRSGHRRRPRLVGIAQYRRHLRASPLGTLLRARAAARHGRTGRRAGTRESPGYRLRWRRRWSRSGSFWCVIAVSSTSSRGPEVKSSAIRFPTPIRRTAVPG